MRINLILILLFFSILGSAQNCDSIFRGTAIITESRAIDLELDGAYESSLQAMGNALSGKEKKILKTQLADRREAVRNMLETGMLITEGELQGYIQSVSDRIKAGKNINTPIPVCLVRDETPNAFNMGDDRLFVNLGLIARLNNEDELAFILGHELGHNELDHYDSKLEDQLSMMTNDSIVKRTREISASKYGQVTALNKLMIPWILANRNMSRRFEEEADDFGYETLVNGRYDPQKAVSLFDILENSDEEYDTTEIDYASLLYLGENASDYSNALHIKIESSLGAFIDEKDTLDDLLRTHPFEVERRRRFIDAAKVDTTKPITFVDPEFARYTDLARKEMIIAAMNSNRIDRAVFYLIQRWKHDTTDVFTRKYLPFCFAYLAWSKKNFQSGNLLGLQSPDHSKNFNGLLSFLRNLTAAQCLEIATGWNTRFGDKNPCECTDLSAGVVKFLTEGEKSDLQAVFDLENKKENNYMVISIFDAIINH